MFSYFRTYSIFNLILIWLCSDINQVNNLCERLKQHSTKARLLYISLTSSIIIRIYTWSFSSSSTFGGESAM